MNATFILNTYGKDLPEDGLSIVFHRVKEIAPLLDSALGITGKPVVLVPGVPTLYVDRMARNHINIAMTTFEGYPLPQNWINALHDFYSAVIVPHESVKQLFEESGVRLPIYIVHQGFTRLRVLPKTPRNKDSFKIGFLGVPTERKNLSSIIGAVADMSRNIEVELYIHIPKFYPWLEESKIRSEMDRKFVHFSEGFKADEELSAWYHNLDAYIFPSSGEGWSFTPRESLSLGIITVISDIPVHQDITEFCKVMPLPITPKNIQESLVEVVRNEVHFQDLANRGQIWIKDKYLNQEVTNGVKSILEKFAMFEY